MLQKGREQHLDEVHYLLRLAEQIVECGVDANLLSVCYAHDRPVESSGLVLLGNDHSPLPPDVWHQLSEGFKEPSALLCSSGSFAASPTDNMESPSLCNEMHPTALSPVPSGQYLISLTSLPEHESPGADFPPKTLFSEQVTVWNLGTDLPSPAVPLDGSALSTTCSMGCRQGKTDKGEDDSYSEDKISSTSATQFIRSLAQQVAVCGGPPLEESQLSNADVVYCWITQNYGMVDNAALAAAGKLSERLQVPLLAVMVVENECIEDLGPPTLPRDLSPPAGNRNPKRKYSTAGQEEGLPQNEHQPRAREAARCSIQRRSAIRLAVLENTRKELCSLGVTVVCVSIDSHACSDASEEELHPEAHLWRILCGTTTDADSILKGHNRRSVVVTDDCSLPKHSLVVKQIASPNQDGPLVFSVASSERGSGVIRSQEESPPIPTQFSVSEAATQLLERVSTVPGARVVGLAQYEGRIRSILQPYWEDIASVLYADGTGARNSNVDGLTLWSAAGAKEVLHWCGQHSGPIPESVASLLCFYQDVGLLTLPSVENLDTGYSGLRGTEQKLDAVRALVYEQEQLLAAWRVRGQFVNIPPQYSPISGLASWPTQWLDGLSAKCVSSIRCIDAALSTSRPTAVQARTILAALHSCTTTDGELNGIQRTLARCGAIARRPLLKQWLCGLIRLLRSVEGAVRVAYVELATHSLWPIDAGWHPVLQFLSAVEGAVNDLSTVDEREAGGKGAIDTARVVNILRRLCAGEESTVCNGAARFDK